MSKTTSGAKKSPRQSRTETRTTPEQPWGSDWRNVKRRREQGVDKIGEWNLRKRKTRHLAQQRDIDRQRAANLLKYGDAEVADEEVL